MSCECVWKGVCVGGRCGWSYLQRLVGVHGRLSSLAQSLAMCGEKTTRQFQSSVVASCSLDRQKTERQTKGR